MDRSRKGCARRSELNPLARPLLATAGMISINKCDNTATSSSFVAIIPLTTGYPLNLAHTNVQSAGTSVAVILRPDDQIDPCVEAQIGEAADETGLSENGGSSDCSLGRKVVRMDRFVFDCLKHRDPLGHFHFAPLQSSASRRGGVRPGRGSEGAAIFHSVRQGESRRPGRSDYLKSSRASALSPSRSSHRTIPPAYNVCAASAFIVLRTGWDGKDVHDWRSRERTLRVRAAVAQLGGAMLMG